MSLAQTVRRWFTPPAPPMADDSATAPPSEAVLDHQAYWRGFNDGRRQAALSYLLTGDAARVTRA